MIRKAMILLSGLALVAWTAGCRVQVDKDASGKEKRVQVDTPFGGVHVNTDRTTAADLGLPVYPGATVVRDEEKHQSADIHMGFGEWQLRVRAVSYSSADSQDKIAAFYKNALGRYGNVITCQGNKPVGTPTVTSEGLSCSDGDKDINVETGDLKNGKNPKNDSLQLKAGSKHHQHIVGFEDSKGGTTRFALVALDLPSGIDSSGKSD